MRPIFHLTKSYFNLFLNFFFEKKKSLCTTNEDVALTKKALGLDHSSTIAFQVHFLGAFFANEELGKVPAARRRLGAIGF